MILTDEYMEKVAILARVSTQGQDYERQVVELTDYCQRMNWEVVKVFANKVSGASKNADREEITALVEYVKEHKLNRVVCLEISRLGRNTFEALKVITTSTSKALASTSKITTSTHLIRMVLPT